jgi:hypothetical protein
VLIFTGCNPLNPPPVHARSGPVVFLGDSIFARWDLNAFFPAKNYVDAGIAGQTTQQILARVQDTISGNNVCEGDAGIINCQTIMPPGTIIIFVGWNDLFQGTSPHAAVADIRQMAELCIASNVQPILVTVYLYNADCGSAPRV